MIVLHRWSEPKSLAMLPKASSAYPEKPALIAIALAVATLRVRYLSIAYLAMVMAPVRVADWC